METWTARQGSSADWTIALRDADGQPVVGVYTGSETLSLQIWAGDDQAPASVPGVEASWDDPGQGTVSVALDGDDLAALAPGYYRVLLRLTTGGRTYDAFEATLLVEPQPGASSALSTYCTFDDLRREGPWVDQLVTDRPSMRADCSEERHRARLWLDRQILARARVRLERYAEGHLPPPEGDPILPDDFDGQPSAILARLDALQAHLDADRLRTSDGSAGEIAAHYALYLLGRAQPGQTSDETAYQKLAAIHRGLALRELAATPFVLDVEDDEGRLVELHP